MVDCTSEHGVAQRQSTPGLTDKQIGHQLIIDIARYRNTAGCKKLVCFVFDPDDRIVNRAGFETDLSRSDRDFSVDVLVFPRR